MSTTAHTEVMHTAHALVAAFGSHNPQAYFEFFAPEATFIFYSHPEMLSSRGEWERLWKQWEVDLGFRVHSCESLQGQVQMIGSDVAIFRHGVITSVEMEGVIDTVRERETIVFHRDGSRWRAVHEHLSPWEEPA